MSGGQLGRTGSIQEVRGTVGANWGREKLVINGEKGDGSTFSRVII